MDTGKKFLLTIGTGRESRKRLRLLVCPKSNGKYQSKCKIQGVCLMNNQDNIVDAKKAIVGSWFGRPGVVGMDVGFKYVAGKPTADVAIRLFVRKKLAEVTAGERFPSLVGQHKTDVIEYEFEASNGRDNQLAGRGGFASSGKTDTAGTSVIEFFGGLQWSGGTLYPLTCSEIPTPPPTDMNGNIIGAWGQSVSGIGVTYSPKQKALIPWTLTNVFQTLTFRAAVSEFNQPVFRWWINNLQVERFQSEFFWQCHCYGGGLDG